MLLEQVTTLVVMAATERLILCRDLLQPTLAAAAAELKAAPQTVRAAMGAAAMAVATA
jgi:hypothetical protein